MIVLPPLSDPDSIVSSLFLFDPSKRFFWASLLTTFLIIIMLSKTRVQAKHNLTLFFSKRIWLHPSSLADMKILGINSLLRLGFSFANIVPAMAVAAFVAISLTKVCGQRLTLNWPPLAISISFALLSFLVDDLSRYALHRLQHRSQWLWLFHQVHHSATVMTPLTLFRTHPIDSLGSMLRNAISFGTVSGLFYFGFGTQLSAWDILGVNTFQILFNLAGANLRHSMIYLHFGPLDRWLLSPAAHQIHHSRDPRHYDKNFGVSLSIWDRCFGSYCDPRKQEGNLHFGLKNSVLSADKQSVLTLYFQPVQQFLKLLLN